MTEAIKEIKQMSIRFFVPCFAVKIFDKNLVKNNKLNLAWKNTKILNDKLTRGVAVK